MPGGTSAQLLRSPDVVALERAVDLISEGFFDGHNVLFADSQKKLTSSHETSRLLVVAYNCFAEENGKESIDMEDIEPSPGRKVDHLLNEWVMLSRSKVLVVIRPVWIADVFAAFPNPQAKRDVIVLVLTERNELNLIQRVGSTIGIREISRILVVGHLRELLGLLEASDCDVLRALRPRGG